MELHKSSGRWRLGLALSLVTVFLWGILPIALAITLKIVDAYTLTWFRFLAAFSILAVYLAAKKQLPPLEKLRSTSVKLLVIATVFLALNYILYVVGLDKTSPANAQVLIQLAPVLMGLGGLFIFKEHYNLRQWLGLSILTLGFALFFHEKLNNLIITAQGKYLTGSAIIVVAAASWAVYSLAQKQLLQQLPSANIMLIIYGGSALLFTPFASPEKILIGTQNFTSLQGGVLIFCALNTVIAYGSFAESLQHWEASRVSAILATTPIVTLIAVWAVSLLAPHLIPPEPITLLAIFGAMLIVAGSITIALGKTKS